MPGRVIRALIGFSVIFAGTPSAASEQAPGSSPRTVWALDFEESHCTITTGDPENIGVSFWMTPGDPEPTLYVVGPSPTLSGLNGKIAIEFAPHGQHFDGDVGQIMRGKARVLEVGRLTHEFSAAFAGSNQLTLARGQARASIPIKGASKAYAALQQCVETKLREWGVDPKPLSALRRPPTQIEGSFWISGDDYPADAMRADWSGYVVVRLNVDPTGDVSDCAVVVSSGWKSVDDVTCRKAISRAKFHPAVSADGNPTSAIRLSNIRFRLE